MREIEKAVGKPAVDETAVGETAVGQTAVERLRSALRRMFGMPDYESYLEHCRRAGHPPRLSEREYVKEFFDNKGKAPRCC